MRTEEKESRGARAGAIPPGDVPTLSDNDMVTVKVDRRSLLSRAGMAAAVLTVGGAATSCVSDSCDSDTTTWDSDSGSTQDPIRIADSCDSD